MENSVNINWFPGHMAKAKRQMQESLKMVDMIIEIRDARIPYASANPLIEQLINQKPRLVVLSKKDKADPAETDKWIKALSKEETMVIAIDSLHERVANDIVSAGKELMKAKIERMIRKGMKPRPIRAMVVGIPNVGKSTLINKIANKKVAETADRPGVTKSLQWIKLNKDMELLDTPGVLWPKFEDKKVAMLLALTGAIRDQILNMEDIAAFGMSEMMKHHPELLKEHYGIELCDDPYENLMNVGRARGLLKKENEVDFMRTVEYFVNELRDDKCGRITWEYAEEMYQQ